MKNAIIDKNHEESHDEHHDSADRMSIMIMSKGSPSENVWLRMIIKNEHNLMSKGSPSQNV